jgi:hypothetical protein
MASVVSHQTVRLARGQHSSPDHGVCVVELASMLSGETFSDHPRCVSPAIAALLRRYNDLLDGGRRQDLYDYAARIVGTASGSTAVERERVERLLSWGDEMWQGRTGAVADEDALRRRQRRRCHDYPSAAARYALQSAGAGDADVHTAVLALVDELIALGSAADPAAPVDPEVVAREVFVREPRDQMRARL